MEILLFICYVAILVDLSTGRLDSPKITKAIIKSIALLITAVPLLFLAGIYSYGGQALWAMVTGYLCLRLILTRASQHSWMDCRTLCDLGIYYNVACLAGILLIAILMLVLPSSMLSWPSNMPTLTEMSDTVMTGAALLIAGPVLWLFGLFFYIFTAGAIGLPDLTALGPSALTLAAGACFLLISTLLGWRTVRSATAEGILTTKERYLLSTLMLPPFLNLVTMLVLKRIRLAKDV